MSVDSERDFNACNDYFVMVVDCHIIAAALKYLHMSSVSDYPSHPLLEDESLCIEESKDERSRILQLISEETVC